jgi:hypothetical protein
VAGGPEKVSNIQQEQQSFSMNDLNTIFTHFPPQEIEEFYQLYQLWSLRQRHAEIVGQIDKIAQQIIENETRLKAIRPSPIALATLSQFRASGVDDLDLLDRMLEREDVWLDHTLQLFERCEHLNMLQGTATEWCEHALEGAYDWLGSMNDTNEQGDSDNTLAFFSTIPTTPSLTEIETEALPATTEEHFLQKLMSEDGELLEQPKGKEVSDEQQAKPDPETETKIESKPVITTEDNLTQMSDHKEIKYAILGASLEVTEVPSSEFNATDVEEYNYAAETVSSNEEKPSKQQQAMLQGVLQRLRAKFTLW